MPCREFTCGWWSLGKAAVADGRFSLSPSQDLEGRSISTTFRIRRGVFGGLGTSTCERSRGPSCYLVFSFYYSFTYLSSIQEPSVFFQDTRFCLPSLCFSSLTQGNRLSHHVSRYFPPAHLHFSQTITSPSLYLTHQSTMAPCPHVAAAAKKRIAPFVRPTPNPTSPDPNACVLKERPACASSAIDLHYAYTHLTAFRISNTNSIRSSGRRSTTRAFIAFALAE